MNVSPYFRISTFFFFLCSPDYLNNLSPDSKEYEDTQGKPGERSLEMLWNWVVKDTLQLLDTHQGLVVEIQPLSESLLNSVKSLCLFCSCLGDRVRCGRPGQWQSETGGEFNQDKGHVFITFMLLSSCCFWHSHSTEMPLLRCIFLFHLATKEH